jgi:hypothetical protein
VPSFISNSNNANWGKCWALALVIALCVLVSLELFWRLNGHKPAVVDDQRLWSLERNKIGKSKKEIVLLGSSRMETDISMETLRKLAAHYNIVNLSIDGTCANAVLRDIAGDKSFKGVVIMETTSECLMFGDDVGLSQQSYPHYYHNMYNLNVKINRMIATSLQKNLAIVDPYLNLIKVLGDFLLKKKLRPPNYLTTNEDRSRSADYTKLDIEHHRVTRLKKVNEIYDKLASRISDIALLNSLNTLENAVEAIQDRGGKVVFIRFPVSDEHWSIDEKYFPKAQYWDNLSSKTKAEVIHFQEISEMAQLKCPDTSHLDFRDTSRFTNLLFAELLKRNISSF